MYVHTHLEITLMKITQSSFGPLLQLFFQTTPIRNKLNILKGNKIAIKFSVNLKASFAFKGANFTNNILHAFNPMGLDLRSVK